MEETSQTNIPPVVEEIDSASVATTSKPVVRPTTKREESMPNPLLEDPYEWEKCTITLIYTLAPDSSVSIIVYNHKDEPIIRSFAEEDIVLPEQIRTPISTLKSIWPDSTISATIVLLPKSPDAADRMVVISVRANADTPIIMTALLSNLPLSAVINSMLEELKALLPARALKYLEKDAKAKAAPAQKSAVKTMPKVVVKPASTASTAPTKTQLSLF